MKYQRQLNLVKLLKPKSFFLFGPRSTGKTTLIKEQLSRARVYDLLDAEVYQTLLKRPKIIEEETLDPKQIVVIDEVQRIPSILNEVQRLITNKGLKFLLTGSSARKLKRGGANLLAGRAWEASLFPLCYPEIKNFDLIQYLNNGGLPQVYGSSFPEEELASYVGTYLREEIQAEAVTRNIQAFAEFLDAIALANGQEINYQSLASDCQVSASTLKNYIQILEDTLIGFSLPAFTQTKKRKAISRSKHFLFDIGVVNHLCRRGSIKSKSELFGVTFEHFIILEVRSFLSYSRSRLKMGYWRSTSQFEVDLTIGEKVAIEVKSTELVQDKHLKGLKALKEENLFDQYIVVSMDSKERRTQDGIRIIPWRSFLELLWSGQIVKV